MLRARLATRALFELPNRRRRADEIMVRFRTVGAAAVALHFQIAITGIERVTE